MLQLEIVSRAQECFTMNEEALLKVLGDRISSYEDYFFSVELKKKTQSDSFIK